MDSVTETYHSISLDTASPFGATSNNISIPVVPFTDDLDIDFSKSFEKSGKAKFEQFSKLRQNIYSKYFPQNTFPVTITLKYDRQPPPSSPIYSSNQSYKINIIDQSSSALESSEPLEIMNHQAFNTLGNPKSNKQELGFLPELSNKYPTSRSSGRLSNRRSKQNDNMQFEMNKAWCETFTLDLDDVGFIYKTETEKPIPESSEHIPDDFIEEATRTAREELTNTVEFFEAFEDKNQNYDTLNSSPLLNSSPESPKISPKGKQKKMTASELNKEWQFSDPKIAKMIIQAMAKSGEGPPKK